MLGMAILFSAFLSDILLFAQEMSIVAVGEAQTLKTSIFFSSEKNSKWTKKQNNQSDRFFSILKDDFAFYKQFFTLTSDPKEAFYVGTLQFFYQKNFTYKFSLREQKENKIVFEAEGRFDRPTLTNEAHRLASKVYMALTGKESVFESHIVFVSDRDSTKKRLVKELYIMDFNGKRKRKLTNHRSIVMSPAISPDGSKILYSLIEKKRGRNRNINLYLLDQKSGKTSLLSNRKGINSGAVFTPDGESILVTLSYKGNAEIYKMNLSDKKLTPLTRNGALDVDPSPSPRRGGMVAFLSGRSGQAHVYILDPSGVEKNVRRVSFVGRFNATPRFSPDGSELAFASWIDKRFDIVRIGIDGNNLVRLTKNLGSNEDPTYSNDGQFIAFSSKKVLSKRKAVHNIYVMTRDGLVIGPVTQKYGKCITPRWSQRRY